MPSALVDSGVLIAALHGRDRWHGPALAILKAADAKRIPPLVITDFILAETLNFLVRKAGSSVARQALALLESSPGVHFVRVSDAAFLEAKEKLFREYDGLSLVDCLSVAHLRERSVRNWYSFDEGFDQVRGIRRLTAIPN